MSDDGEPTINDETRQARRAERVFEDVSEVPAADRPAAIAALCGADTDLRHRVESLAAALDEASRFLADRTVTGGGGGGGGATATVAEQPGTVIGPFKLLQRIGEGGFGVVYMAAQTRPVKRRVALKILKLGMDTRDVVARFEAERQALALMDHPNIAKVHDAGATDAGRPYFVMELVNGVPITAYADASKLTARQRLELMVPVCRAVQHAHTKGVIHRDIKPGNVLVTLHDGKPVPKVIDFGIAKATGATLTDHTLFTRFGSFVGTPAYMSPEQAERSGLDVDTRTDVYGLGVLLYELLTGTTPIDAKALRTAAYERMFELIRESDPPRPSTRLTTDAGTQSAVAAARGTNPKRLGQAVRGEVDWIVMKALEKDRNRRYESASALADDLGRYLAGEAVLAGPVSGTYRLRKAVRRHRVAVGVGSAVAACLLLGMAGTTWGLVREAEQRHRAETAGAEAMAQRAEAERQATDARAARADAIAQRDAAKTERDYGTLGRAASHMTTDYQAGRLPQALHEGRIAVDIARRLKSTRGIGPFLSVLAGEAFLARRENGEEFLNRAASDYREMVLVAERSPSEPAAIRCMAAELLRDFCHSAGIPPESESALRSPTPAPPAARVAGTLYAAGIMAFFGLETNCVASADRAMDLLKAADPAGSGRVTDDVSAAWRTMWDRIPCVLPVDGKFHLRLGNTLFGQRRFASAEFVFREAWAWDRAHPSPANRDGFPSLRGLNECLRLQGKPPAYQPTEPDPNDPAAVEAAGNAALAAADWRTAADLFHTATRLRRRATPVDDRAVTDDLFGQGSALQYTDQVGAAVGYLSAAAAANERSRGIDDPATAAVAMTWATLLDQRHKAVEAAAVRARFHLKGPTTQMLGLPEAYDP